MNRTTPCALVGLIAAVLGPLAGTANAAPASATFKVAFYNIQSGKGEPALAGHDLTFPDTSNCTNPTQPLNAWGIGLVQQHLVETIGNDPAVVALGLAEAWTCGSPENVRATLGWKARSGDRNGVAMVARYGFAGPEEWLQLDTTANTNPADTKWVLRVPVCLDAACALSINMFVTHWLGSGADPDAVFDRQAQATVAFMGRTAGTAPSLLIGDLNLWESSVSSQEPPPAGISRLREAGYVDAWPLVNGSAEGFTGMVNRAGRGSPVGAPWKRVDYTWSPAAFLPTGITRFGVVPPGDAAPSDHYGLITEFPLPPTEPRLDAVAPTVALLSPIDGLTVSTGPVLLTVAASDDVGVTRVEILEDGVLVHTLPPGETSVACAALAAVDGPHTIVARAFDGAGNIGLSAAHRITVTTAGSVPPIISPTGEIVLHARNASVLVGNWRTVADATAAGGAHLWNPDAGAPKLPAALASPAHYFELTFAAEAGRAYRLWLRGRAERDFWGNDSVYVQFSGSVSATGSPVMRTGTTDAAWVSLEDCSGCGLQGWGWQDNGYGAGVLGPLVWFAASGPQTIRIQQREDGASVDQIVLSPAQYLTASPGTTRVDGLILPQTQPGSAPDPVPSPVPASGGPEILLTSRAATQVVGLWRTFVDASASGGMALGTSDAGVPKVAIPAAAPNDYVDLAFYAEAGRAYRLWIRGRADRDVWSNDSAFVQFSGSVDSSDRPVARIGTAEAWAVNLEEGPNAGLAGWGWQDSGYGPGVLGPLVRFAATGIQTLRLQTREDGYRIDQVVLSAERFLTAAPGPPRLDATILP